MQLGVSWYVCAGCFVRGEGVTRWALQKFKEDPTGGAPAVFWDTPRPLLKMRTVSSKL